MTADQAVGTSPRAARGDRGLIVCLSYAALTGAIVAGLGNPLIHEVAVTRDVSVAAAEWILITTLLVGAVATPILSRFADGRTRKRVLVATLAVIAAGSAIALVPWFPALLGSRALQGLGYALVPLTVSVAREHLRGPTLATTLGVLSVSVAVGVGLGNPLIGLCVMVGDYRAPFLLAVAVAGSAAWWVHRRVPASGQDVEPVTTDPPGALLLAGGLGAALLAVACGPGWGWTSPRVLALGVSGALLLGVWSLVELRTSTPLVDLRLSCSTGVFGANAVATLLGVGMFGGASVVMMVIQRTPEGGVGLGRSVFVTGLLMMPMALASFMSPLFGRRLGRVFGLRSVLVFGSLFVAAAFGYFALRHGHEADIAVMMLLMGAGIGLAYSVMPAVIIARVPTDRTASAIGTNQVLRLMGGSVGAALVAAVLTAYTPSGSGQPTEAGYVVAAVLSSAGAATAALVSWLMLEPPSGRPAPLTRPVDPSTWGTS